MWDALGEDKLLTTVLSGDGDAGSIAYSWPVHLASFENGGTVGDLHEVSVSAQASGDDVEALRGTIVESQVDVDAGTDTSEVTTLQAVAAGEQLVALAHVFTSTPNETGTLDLKVQSTATAPGPGVTPTYTDRITFDQIDNPGAEGSYRKGAAGAITDTHYRVSATVAGTSVSFTYVVILAIV